MKTGERTNLKVFRVKRGMTQGEMADAMGYTRPTYAAIEKGSRDGRAEFWSDFQKTFGVPDEEMWALTKQEKQD